MRRMIPAVVCLILIAFAGGCTTFRYEYASRQATDAAPRGPEVKLAPQHAAVGFATGLEHTSGRGALRVGVRLLRNCSAAKLYFPPYGAVLAEPYEDLSRGLASALERSGAFARVVYLENEAAAPEDLDAVLSGEVTYFTFNGIMEPWSMIPPVNAMWALTILGFPTGPSRNGAILECRLRMAGIRPETPSWQIPRLRATYSETVWYSWFNILGKDEQFTRTAMDHLIDRLAAEVIWRSFATR